MTNTDYYSLFDNVVKDLQADHREGPTKAISTLMNIYMRLEQ